MTTQVILFQTLTAQIRSIGVNAFAHAHVMGVENEAFGSECLSSFEEHDDDEFAFNRKLRRKSTLEAEPSDPFRYPDGIQFYLDKGYSTANKMDPLIVYKGDEHTCFNEAIPDICLRADEGDLNGVKRIVQAAAAVSDFEKRATVNKARKWVKFIFHKHGMPTALEWYDGTPLVHACLNGHHHVVEYLLEQGADPTLRGAMISYREKKVLQWRGIQRISN
jgi:hypothetical protein